MNRREFLCGLAATGFAGIPTDGESGECGRGRPGGLVALELRGKFELDGLVEDADAVGRAASGRFVFVDLDRAEDWGDLKPYEDASGCLHVEYGNDESGYWHVARAYELGADEETRELRPSELAGRILSRLGDFSGC